VTGLILISPLLDFREYSGSSLLQYVGACDHGKRGARGQRPDFARRHGDVEKLCTRDFLNDLIKPGRREGDDAAADRVAGLTGSDQAVSRQTVRPFDISDSAANTIGEAQGDGRYDPRSWARPIPDSSFHHFGRSVRRSDCSRPLTSAVVDLTPASSTGDRTAPTNALRSVNRAWDFGRGRSLPNRSRIEQILPSTQN